MKPLFLVLALFVASATSNMAAAAGRLLDVTVFDRTSEQELPVYLYQGRYYVAGQPGHRYQLQLRNRGDQRLLGVLSVDGVNAISGDNADWSQTGYVLSAFSSADILGWRKSMAQVADFVFADAAQSYAARTGRPDNVGVIGVAVFRPMPPPRRLLPMNRSAIVMPPVSAPAAPASPIAAMPAPAPLAESTMSSSPLGTGHGQREDSATSYTNFTRASTTPDEIITLYYDTRERLIAQGVISPSDVARSGMPQPFPGHFVPDP